MPKSETSLTKLLSDIRRIEEHREILTEKKIKAIYNSLSDDLTAFVGKEYVKYADEEGRLFLSYLDAKNQRAKFLQEIVDNVDNISPTVAKEIETLVNTTYRKSYKGMVEALQKVDSIAEFEAIAKDLEVNPNVLKRAVNNNISKLTLPTVLEKFRNETIYQIQQELNIGLMQGDRYEKMAKRISERVGISERKATNIARTETHRNIESGFMDCAENLQEKLDGSDLIYAATWRTMKDERVRPQRRYKTKKGWKTVISKNGANHQKMEGVTVKAGELFDLGNGVKTKAPSQSGVAAHDCQCRCFIEFNLMTIEEFAKATNQTPEQVRKKYELNVKTDDVKENTLTSSRESSIIEAEKYTVKTPGNVGEKAIPYSERGIEIEERLQGYLKELKEDGNYISGAIGEFSLQDLAILTTETGVEFTSITVGGKSILIRGTDKGTTIPQNIFDDMMKQKGILNGHSHPHIGDIIPSDTDMELLANMPWQAESTITDPYQNTALFNRYGTVETSKVDINKAKDYYDTVLWE